MRKPLAITCGDPAGVGPEIIEAWLGARREIDAVCVFGPESWLARLVGVEKVAVGPADFVAEPGVATEPGAQVALAAMEAAAAACAQGRCSGVVTGPVSKEWLQRVGFPFAGQTEFFAARWGGQPTMAFSGASLRVVLATWHIPLQEVGPLLRARPELLERAVHRAHEFCRSLGIGEPRIAVCGLNPHAGEGGLLGREEREFLDPALDRFREKLAGVSHCLPGDTVFWRARRGDFDAVVALYHDQGLGPLKTVEFDRAVNVTLGLPHVRTSPDHGTGFDIAGRGITSGESFRQAVSLAYRLIDNACAPGRVPHDGPE